MSWVECFSCRAEREKVKKMKVSRLNNALPAVGNLTDSDAGDDESAESFKNTSSIFEDPCARGEKKTTEPNLERESVPPRLRQGSIQGRENTTLGIRRLPPRHIHTRHTSTPTPNDTQVQIRGRRHHAPRSGAGILRDEIVPRDATDLIPPRSRGRVAHEGAVRPAQPRELRDLRRRLVEGDGGVVAGAVGEEHGDVEAVVGAQVGVGGGEEVGRGGDVEVVAPGGRGGFGGEERLEGLWLVDSLLVGIFVVQAGLGRRGRKEGRKEGRGAIGDGSRKEMTRNASKTEPALKEKNSRKACNNPRRPAR